MFWHYIATYCGVPKECTACSINCVRAYAQLRRAIYPTARHQSKASRFPPRIVFTAGVQHCCRSGVSASLLAFISGNRRNLPARTQCFTVFIKSACSAALGPTCFTPVGLLLLSGAVSLHSSSLLEPAVEHSHYG